MLPLLIAGTLPNVSRNAIVNVAEIVCYDVFKEYILTSQLMRDGVPCHFTAAVMAGFCTTVVASPVDVVKTRFGLNRGFFSNPFFKIKTIMIIIFAGNYSWISLDNNNLTNFQSSVFQSTLNANQYSSVNINGSNDKT